MKLLRVDNVSVEYHSQAGVGKAITEVSFDLAAGESLGIIGESGCGKTTLARSILRLLPKSARIPNGTVHIGDTEVFGLTEDEMRRVRLSKVGFITQSAMHALDPVYRVGDQIVEGIRAHSKLNRNAAWRRAEELFELVGIDRQRLYSYPHQLSGGMRQRVVIAIALSMDPPLVIADEPTTALDVIVQDKILRKLKHLQRLRGLAMIYVTHDISVVAESCDSVAVMYAGRIVEKASTRAFFALPSHPYSMGLQRSVPQLHAEDGGGEIVSIPGYPPSLLGDLVGCSFAPRCPFATRKCIEERPPYNEIRPGHFAACHYSSEAAAMRAATRDASTWAEPAIARSATRDGDSGASAEVRRW